MTQALTVLLGALLALVCATPLYLIATAPPPMESVTDQLDFASLARSGARPDAPDLQRFAARDGEQLSFRFYDSSADRVLIFLHGSSYHGGGYHALASALSQSGAAKVVLPNLRGHFQSGRHRGDVDYIGQLEDDIADLIGHLRAEHFDGPVTLGGHSSGGGLAIRSAGGSHRGLVTSFVLLSPIIPRSPAVRGGNAGGWASLHWRRLFGLLALNLVGIHGFDALPIVTFNKPVTYWDGTETLTYSYRLNVSLHPRANYQADISALGDDTLVLVGETDQAVDPAALREVFAQNAPRAQVAVLPGTSHLGIFSDPACLTRIGTWLKALPPHPIPAR